MPPESQLSHRNVRNAGALPYASLVSPTNTEPAYVTGSQDILTSIKGYAERRPGFANVDATGFNNLQRVFTWDRFDGTFVKMFSDLNSSGFAQVYKWVIGVDTAPVSIFTDTVSTPFDFNVSNNTVYFGNGHTMQKWDPVNGLSNWGISIGQGNSTTDAAGAGANGTGSGIAWTNPNNVTSAVSYATETGNVTPSKQLQATQFGFGLISPIVGIQVTCDVFCSVAGQTLTAQILKASVGSSSTRQITMPTSSTNVSFGGPSDLWGTTFSSADVNNTGFGVQFQASNAFGGSTTSIRNVKITIYGNGGPSITVSGSSGTFSATTGYVYVYCYGNSNTGHISSPTPQSSSTSSFSSKLNVQVSLVASTDAQVNQIRVFRSTDSVATGNSAGTLFELPTSPYPNTTANITDSATDLQLNQFSIAPSPGFNDPPPAWRGTVYFSGRFWGFAGNKVYFTDLEECIVGVPEESYVSGIAGNFWSFDQPVQGLAVAGAANGQTLIVFSGGRLYGIVGNSLDTFRRFTISTRHGCRSVTAIATLGAMVAWLDSSNQIWGTDGSSLQELGQAIRPDTAALVPGNVSMTFHVAGNFHWLVVSTGTKLLVYDMDTEQWMPPWSFAAQYVFSGETAPGSYQLFGATAANSLTLSTVNHNDNGSFYAPIGRTSLMALVPDFGTRFSLAAMGLYDEPSRTGYPAYFQIDTNTAPLTDFLIMADDDPLNANTTYTSIFANLQPPSTAFNRGQGLYLVQNIFVTTQPTSRWIGVEWKGSTQDDSLKVFGWYLAYKNFR